MKKKNRHIIRFSLAAALPVLAVAVSIFFLQSSVPAKTSPASSAPAFPQAVNTDSIVHGESSGAETSSGQSAETECDSRIPSEPLRPIVQTTDHDRQTTEPASFPSDLFQHYLDFCSRSAAAALRTADDVCAFRSNSFYSPLSMYLATAMLAESTAGSTQKELLDALGTADAAELRKQASLLYQHTAFQKDDAALLLSNSFWINSRPGFSYHDSLFETLADHYDAEGYAAPFGTDAAAEQVSKWIADKTRGRLKEQIAAADNPLTTLILINTLYFSSQWEHRLYPDGTKEFQATDGSVRAPYLSGSFVTTVIAAEQYTAADLPMTNGCTMRVVLPSNDRTPNELYTDSALLESICRASGSRMKLHLEMPEFQYTAGLDLTKILPQLSVSRVFHDDADFSPLTNTPGVFLAYAAQKSCITVNENGCEAAAFTYYGAPTKSITSSTPQQQPYLLTLNRPFLYLVIKDGIPVIIGAVNDPTAN